MTHAEAIEKALAGLGDDAVDHAVAFAHRLDVLSTDLKAFNAAIESPGPDGVPGSFHVTRSMVRARHEVASEAMLAIAASHGRLKEYKSLIDKLKNDIDAKKDVDHCHETR